MTSRAVMKSLTPIIILTILVVLLATVLVACGSDATASTTASSIDAVAPSTTVALDSTTSSVAPEAPQPLLIAAASSLKEAFTEIGQAFDQTNNAKTTFTFDASGALQKQIEGGAPVDVFASAAMTQVDNLLKQGLVDEASIRTVAGNELVLAVPADSALGVAGFEDLAKDNVQKVATGDPATAPHGKAAVEILTKLGILDEVQPKLIYAKNASQTLTYVEQGEVDAGIMFVTDAKAGGEKIKVVATSDPSWHGKLAYVMAAVSASKAKTLGQTFIEYVAGPEGQAILQKYGFILASSK